jgi:putative ABC transport system substrate-binding protein
MNQKDYYVSERSYGSFERYFGLPEGVDADKIEASFKDGVLKVMLPKRKRRSPPKRSKSRRPDCLACRLPRVVVLWDPHAYGERTMAGMLKEIEDAARSLGTKLKLVPTASPADLSNAFAAMATERADGLIVIPSPMLFSQYSRIVTFAANNRLPAIYVAREGAELGGLVSYGVNLPDLSRATAIYLDKILKGAKPAELPVQQPTQFELVINLKAAEALGLTISRDLLLIADEVIE